uniref:Uncharacterized protein n=1 Tax=Trichogramma kaykai TaxID=54128 RepID=A0ABD2WLF9_9HYME
MHGKGGGAAAVEQRRFCCVCSSRTEPQFIGLIGRAAASSGALARLQARLGAQLATRRHDSTGGENQ